MVRVSRNLRYAANLLICVGLAGCSSSKDDGEGGDEGGMLRQNLIQFPSMYSAFDGVHDYKLTPSVPIAAENSTDSDPVVASTLKWNIDDAFAKQEAFSELPGAILLTTKKAGTTTVRVTATTKSGLKIRGEAKLEISKADPAEWDAGEARYNNGMTIDFTQFRPMPGQMMPPAAADGGNACGLPVNIGGMIPKNSACGNCHNNMSFITVEHTPTQTAGYSDDQLIEIFTQGMKPAGYMFSSLFLKMLPMPDCIYKSFHTWDIPDDTKRGIVWKLRSITPKKQADVDINRLIAMAMQARAAAAAAAGAPAAGGAAGSAP